MKHTAISCLFLLMLVNFTNCRKYLDINNDPDTPQFPDPSSVFPTQLAAITYGLQRDARYVSRYIQNFGWNDPASTANLVWDQMGYVGASDANGDIWRQTYFGLGQNLNYMIDNGIKNKQWDYVGASYALKALMFQYATDYHGEIIFTEAFRENQAFFKFDDQEVVYRGIDSLCRLAISYLNRTDLDPGKTRLAKGDYVYGQTAPWVKFTYGILARNAHRLTNKASYNADSVISFCDKSLAATADDFVIPFDAQKNDDANFFGTFRNNLTSYRQTNFIVRLLDGTTLSNSSAFTNRDPRIRHMLSASGDTTNGNGGYRGMEAGLGDPLFTSTTGVNANKRVAAVWGDSLYTNPGVNNFSASNHKYLFGNKVVSPVMSASEIQFIKAEAAYRKGDKQLALTAYTKAINLHFDFINRSSFPRSNDLLYNQNPISVSDRNAYLAGPSVRRTADSLKLSDIMLQKYIALWGWGFFETWVDLRRYHYTDLDPATGLQVYLGFALPATLFGANLGKPVYRVRPRFNSEYVWNVEELQRIGGLNSDYQTYETWFSKP